MGRRKGRTQSQAGVGADPVRGSAKQQTEFCNRLYYGPTNPKAYEYVKPEIAKQMPTYPQNAKQTITANAEWEAANSAMLQERFTQWLAS